MDIFDIFKKKKKKQNKKNLDVTDLIKNDLIKVPEVKYDKIKINDDQLNEYVKDSGDNNKLLRTLPENDFPSLGGKIVGYHPHPKNFISLIVKQINRPDLLESVYKRFKDEFIFNHKDLSDDIINKGVISHKRTLNHNEYLEKLNESDLQVINDIMGDVLKQYNKIVSFP